MEDGGEDDVVHHDVGVHGAHVAEEAVLQVGEPLQLVREEHGRDTEEAEQGETDGDDRGLSNKQKRLWDF